MSVLTAGHSTHEPDAFLRLVRPAEVVIDVRSHRTSKWPWFHAEPFQRFVEESGRGYEWEPGLGGWDVRHATDDDLRERMAEVGVDLRAYARGVFPKQRIGRQVAAGEPVEEGKPTWTNRGLLDYAWFTVQPEFREAAARLAARTDRVVIICAEALWWKCHRSMIADYLQVVHGVTATHLLPTSGMPRYSNHDAGARFDRYPVEVQRIWTA